MIPWLEELPGGQNTHYSRGSFIAQPGSGSNRLFALETGRARICLLGGAREQTLMYLTPGSLFVTHTPTWVEALEPTQVRSWPLQNLQALIESNPKVAMAALKEVGRLLAVSLELIESLSLHSVEHRLARYLLRQSDPRTGELSLQDSVSEIATLLGTSRQTLSTLINRMIREQILIRQGRRTFRISQPEYLKALADDLSAS